MLGPPAVNAARVSAAPVHVAQRPGVHPQDRATQPVIPRHLVAQPIRHRQHPLAHRHPRQHLVHQVRRPLRHPPPAAARTDPRSLQEKGTRCSRAQPSHRKRATPASYIPQSRNSRNSRSTNWGSPAPPPASATAPRKASRCSAITRWSTVCSTSRGRYRGTTQPMPRRSAFASLCHAQGWIHRLTRSARAGRPTSSLPAKIRMVPRRAMIDGMRDSTWIRGQGGVPAMAGAMTW
jgi:hypothetical protein